MALERGLKVDFVYRDLFYSGEGSNYHHYSDAHADELIDTVATEKDQDVRRAASTELQEYLVDACPRRFLCTSQTSLLHTTAISRVSTSTAAATTTGATHTLPSDPRIKLQP